jgi:8-oxo-dGTP pyrophosphatase MutT (NUDIX family)
MKELRRCDCQDIPLDNYHKIAGFLLKDGKTLVVKKKGLDEYISLGGLHESGETLEECLIRESLEELDARVSNPTPLGRFTDKAASDDNVVVVDAYLVETADNPSPSREIEGYAWIGKNPKIKVASIIEKFVLPELVKRGVVS